MAFHPQTQHGALADKTLVVIGGTSGIGLSVAKAFLRAGAKLVVVGLEPDSPEPAAETALGPACKVMHADATKPETAPLAIQSALDHFGGFDGLYHVAGGSGRRWGDGPLHELTDEGWRATLELNLTSVMYSNRAAVRHWLAQGRGGTILNVSSVLAFSPSARFFPTYAYAAAKAAILGLTKAGAAAYASSNIRINAIAPGLVATPMSRRAQTDPMVRKFIDTKQPLDGGRFGRPEDLDAIAVYFMSDASGFTTGQVVAVDGGWSLSDGQAAAAPEVSSVEPATEG
jgi:NAD(P)-dependent dehydrogenase (short-subunit alcohol dehydrogenase family)